MTRPSVVFDFDGTVALGDGPLEAYARELEKLVGAGIAEACRAAIDDYNTGDSDHLDAYSAVRTAATAHDVDDDVLSRAYLASREQLATDTAPIHAPDGLTSFLVELRDHARCVLATNAPDIGIDRSLSELGITGLFDAIHTNVGKPLGLPPIIAGYLADGPTLAIGDIWDNDLAPAARLGADTAFVGPGRITATPTLRGRTLADIYDEILQWARSHRAAATNVPPVRTTTLTER